MKNFGFLLMVTHTICSLNLLSYSNDTSYNILSALTVQIKLHYVVTITSNPSQAPHAPSHHTPLVPLPIHKQHTCWYIDCSSLCLQCSTRSSTVMTRGVDDVTFTTAITTWTPHVKETCIYHFLKGKHYLE